MYSVIIVNGGYYPNVVSVDIYSDKNAASDAMKKAVLEYLNSNGVAISEYSAENLSELRKNGVLFKALRGISTCFYEVDYIGFEDISDTEVTLMCESSGEFGEGEHCLLRRWEVVETTFH